MKRFAKRALALGLTLLMILGALTSAPCLPGKTQIRTAAAEGVSVVEVRVDAGALLAKSKKKKNTPTPAPAQRQAEETAAPTGTPAGPTATPIPEGPIIDPQSIADYLFAHDMTLPENFITKKEAQALGWDSRVNYVSDVAPGKSIGGDYFGNYEEKLPTGKGIQYHEADCWYTKGKRNAYRVIYSTDGRVWYTEDHYNTFEELFPSVP